ncbi:hypothetical protein D9M73_200920 [compost metagenome]
MLPLLARLAASLSTTMRPLLLPSAARLPAVMVPLLRMAPLTVLSLTMMPCDSLPAPV